MIEELKKEDFKIAYTDNAKYLDLYDYIEKNSEDIKNGKLKDTDELCEYLLDEYIGNFKTHVEEECEKFYMSLLSYIYIPQAQIYDFLLGFKYQPDWINLTIENYSDSLKDTKLIVEKIAKKEREDCIDYFETWYDVKVDVEIPLITEVTDDFIYEIIEKYATHPDIVREYCED